MCSRVCVTKQPSPPAYPPRSHAHTRVPRRVYKYVVSMIIHYRTAPPPSFTVSKRISMPWQNPSVGTFYIIFQGIYYRYVLTSQITYIIIFFGVQSNGENANLSVLSFNCRPRYKTDSLCFSFVHF